MRYPHQLSGGQRQRAALAWTLAIEPSIVLLDEPFSALDAQTKLVLQRGLAETIATSGITTLLITHDLSEAVAMSDRILVMSERPARIIEHITVDMPHRENPLHRQSQGRARELMAHLFDALHLEDAGVVYQEKCHGRTGLGHDTGDNIRGHRPRGRCSVGFYGCRISFCTRQLRSSATNSVFSDGQAISWIQPNCFGIFPAIPSTPSILPSSVIL
jgi:ABC-type dipeptide/oligopeptide/nickel transport system ATPase component